MTVICRHAGLYEGRLTPGATYEVIEHDRRHVRILDDIGREDWFPASHFHEPGREPPTLAAWVTGPGASPDAINVHLTMSDASRRWCLFTTPDRLRRALRDEPCLCLRHLVVVEALDRTRITRALRALQARGDLLDCSISMHGD